MVPTEAKPPSNNMSMRRLRTLADDLLTLSHVPNHMQETIAATDRTHKYLRMLGAKVATAKAVLFAPYETDRKKTRH